MPILARLHQRFAALIPELAKFGVVGGIGAIIDLGGAAYLHLEMNIGPLVAKGLSITAATVFTYLGSRFWTFRHRATQTPLREGFLFAVLNVVGLLIAESVIAFTHYGLGAKSALAYNAASLAGTGLGTIFRYFAYKKWVFLAPEPALAMAPAGYIARHAVPQRPAMMQRPAVPQRSGPPWPVYGPAQERLEPASAADPS